MAQETAEQILMMIQVTTVLEPKIFF